MTSKPLPPGQTLTVKWPVLTYGETPRIEPEQWSLRLFGLLDPERHPGGETTLTWDDLRALPVTRMICDMHCVTRWSKLSNRFEGVRVREVLKGVGLLPAASHVMVHASGGYTTNLPLADLTEDDAILAFNYEDRPLEPEHGGPCRLLVPKLYLWKSAKWISGLEFMDTDRAGFWERAGYQHVRRPLEGTASRVELVSAATSRAHGRSRMIVTILFSLSGGILLGTLAASVSPSLVLDSASLLGAPSVAMASPATGEPRTAPVEGLMMRTLDDRQVGYYMAKPEGKGTWPGVVLAHEGWGLDGKFKAVADHLAGLGFVVIAPDLNRGRIALDPDQAHQLGAVVDADAAIGSLDAVADFMKYMPEVGDHGVGLMGFDVGGALALQAAMRSDKVSAVVIIYGPPITDADALRRLGCPVLGIFAAEDTIVPAAKARRFEDALAASSRTYDVKILENAAHGFMSGRDPGDESPASREAWSLVDSFLKARL